MLWIIGTCHNNQINLKCNILIFRQLIITWVENAPYIIIQNIFVGKNVIERSKYEYSIIYYYMLNVQWNDVIF